MSRLFGITVMPEWIQAEGIERVLDNLDWPVPTPSPPRPTSWRRATIRRPGASRRSMRVPAVSACSTAISGAGASSAASRRRASCPIEGALCRAALPAGRADRLTRAEGPKIEAFIAAAKARGFEVHLQVQAAIPPGYRVQFGGPWPRISRCCPTAAGTRTASTRTAASHRPHRGLSRGAGPRRHPGLSHGSTRSGSTGPNTRPTRWRAGSSTSRPMRRAARAKGHDWGAMRAAARRIQANPALVLDEGLGTLETLGRFKADLSVDLLTPPGRRCRRR
jgi:hypothetical protein